MATTKLAVLACSLLIASAAAFAQAAAPEALEQELRARMVALTSAIRGGMSYQDYTRQMQALTALFERYERSGGTTAELRDGHTLLVEARQAWDRVVEIRNRRLSQPVADPETRAAERAREKADEGVIQRSWRRVMRQFEGDPSNPQTE